MEPLAWTIAGEATEVHGNDFVDSLRLPIGMRVECRAQVELDAGEVEELPPEVVGEDGVVVVEMEHGNPWSCTTSSKNTRATEPAVYGCANGTKWAYLEKRLTMVRMTDFLLTCGSPSMKSIEICSQAWKGTSNGCRRPAGWSCSTLYC